MQNFFRCEPGYEDGAPQVAFNVCHKLVLDMHYECRVQAVVTYHAQYLFRKVTKEQARTMSLTKEEYMKVNVQQ